jgi:adenylate cyclase
VNIAAPVTLYEVAPDGQEPWPDWKDVYQRALAAFEENDFRAAARDLIPLCQDPPDDGPSKVLLARAVQALAHGVPPDHPILVLDSK